MLKRVWHVMLFYDFLFSTPPYWALKHVFFWQMIKKIKLSMFYFYITLISLILFIYFFVYARLPDCSNVSLYLLHSSPITMPSELSRLFWFEGATNFVFYFLLSLLFVWCLLNKKEATDEKTRKVTSLSPARKPSCISIYRTMCVCISRRK